MAVVLHHAVGVHTETGHALGLLLQVREDVHAGRVPPAEERLVVLDRLLHELEARVEEFLVDRLACASIVSGPVFSIFCVPSALAQE